MPVGHGRAHALQIFQAALTAADGRTAVRRFVSFEGHRLTISNRIYDLRNYDRVVVVGSGKASVAMARALEEILGDRIAMGLINTKYGHGGDLGIIRINECGHPVPDLNGVGGAEAIAAIADAATASDLILVCVSGGASALLPLPANGLTLEDKQRTTSLLLASGATIHEINAVRKHLSAIKGGQLAARAWPAIVVALILSDVVGDDLDVIGSGVTVPDSSTFADALSVLDRYSLRNRVPRAVLHHLVSATTETPKQGDERFSRTHNVLVGSNRLALEAAAAEARILGYTPIILTSMLQGEARVIAEVFAAVAREIVQSGQPVPRPACILAGGETTVTIKGNGKGGRNQEFALAAAIAIQGLPGVTLLSGGTDGTDGPTDAAGASCTGSTMEQGAALGLSARAYLDHNDSYTFFDATGEIIRTGPTGTNVADIHVMLVS